MERKNLEVGWLCMTAAGLVAFCQTLALRVINIAGVSDVVKMISGQSYSDWLTVGSFNLFLGLSLGQAKLGEDLKKYASVAALLAIVQPVSTLIAIFWKGALCFAWIGTTSLLVAACIMASSASARKA